MLVKKNVLNEINKEGTFTQGFMDCRKIKRKVSENLDDLQNLLIRLTVKASSEKACVLSEFPFSLNPGDKPNPVRTISSRYKRPVPSKFKEKLIEHFRSSKIKSLPNNS